MKNLHKKKRRKKRLRNKALVGNGRNKSQMKDSTVKKRMMMAIKDLEKQDICTINSKVNKIKTNSLRIRCMM